jgi:hypothetical protein
MTSGAKAESELWKGSEEKWRIKGTESKSESKSGSSARYVTTSEDQLATFRILSIV